MFNYARPDGAFIRVFLFVAHAYVCKFLLPKFISKAFFKRFWLILTLDLTILTEKQTKTLYTTTK